MNRRSAIKQTALILGYAVSATAIAGVMNGCKAEKTIDWTPSFFDKDEAIFINEFSDVILPTTDTPGAKDVGVDQFIDSLINNCYKEEDQKEFRKNLTEFRGTLKKDQGSPFADLSEDQRKKGLDNIIKSDNKFFNKIRGLVVLGYFTSEQIAENYLNYNPIPGAYDGCIPLEETGGKVHAL